MLCRLAFLLELGRRCFDFFLFLCPVGQFHTREGSRCRWSWFASHWAGFLCRHCPNITGGDRLAMFCIPPPLHGLDRRRLGFLLFLRPVSQFHTGEGRRCRRLGRFASRWAGRLCRYRPNIPGGDRLAMFCFPALLHGLGRRYLGFFLFLCPVGQFHTREGDRFYCWGRFTSRRAGFLCRHCPNIPGGDRLAMFCIPPLLHGLNRKRLDFFLLLCPMGQFHTGEGSHCCRRG